jgi:sec-independent protein translocase protein TatC
LDGEKRMVKKRLKCPLLNIWKFSVDIYFVPVLAIAAGAIVFIVYNTFFVREVLMGPTHADFRLTKWLCNLGHAIGLGDKMCMKDIGLKMQSTSGKRAIQHVFHIDLCGGIIVAFPYIFWEFWRFIKPCIDKKRIIKNKRCYLLGLLFIFPGNRLLVILSLLRTL